MRKLIFLLFFILLLPELAAAQDTTRVLFIGNSLTFANDLPGTFRQFALAGGHEVITGESVFGGYTFQMHSSNGATLTAISQGNWDYVVLQEQSQIPSMFNIVNTQFFPWGKYLDSLVHVSNPAAKTVFFLTFAHRNGDIDILSSGGFDTYWLMQGRLRQSYLAMAGLVDAMVAPVGCTWREVRNQYPGLELYSDDVHPNNVGTYLAASVFYSALFQESCTGNSFTAGLDPSTALQLQNAASSMVLDSLSLWNIGSSSGIAEADNNSILVYPNPAEDKIWLQINGLTDEQLKIELSDLQGRIVKSTMTSVANKGDVVILDADAEGIQAGMYLLRIQSHQTTITQKIIIR